jgi:capsular exopolysaccharide synthesis family protein
VGELETPRPGSPPDTRVVVEQRASIPDKPVVPKTARNIALGLAMGVVLGVALALLRDQLDKTVKSPETLEEVAHVGVVGNIPYDKKFRDHSAISFDTANSATAEAFRKLRTNLQFVSVDHPPRLIVVTSSIAGEGKSTTALNIALALAEAEHNVVLVDGDMRRPSISTYLDLVGSVGLSTVISGSSSVAEALQETSFPRLTVLTAGTCPPNPSEIIGSVAAKKVLSELRERFDYVIIDSPPLLAVTDAALLSTGSDGTLIIARFGHTKREQITNAVESLEKVDATLLGAVITMSPARGTSSYGYGYYPTVQQ